MTEFSNNSNSKNVPNNHDSITTETYNNVASRPDRNTHNGKEAQIHEAKEENKIQMMDAVRNILDAVGENQKEKGF